MNYMKSRVKFILLLIVLGALVITAQPRAMSADGIPSAPINKQWTPPSAVVPVYFVTDRHSENANGKRQFTPKRHFHSQCDYGVSRVALSWSAESPEIKGPLWLMGWRPSSEQIGKSKSESPPIAKSRTNELVADKNMFFTQLKAAMDLSPGKQVILFVHGYNNSFESAIETAAELEYYFQSPVVAFSWPSQHATDKYTFDECNSEWSLRDFRTLLTDLDSRIGASNVVIVGHSMGNRLLLWGLVARADRARVTDQDASPPHYKAIVFSSPDVDSGTMRNWAWLVERNSDAKWLFVSHKDIPLRLSRGVHGNKRAGGIGKLPMVADVDLAWNEPDVLFGIQTLDFTNVDQGFMGHSVPYQQICSAVRSGQPAPGYSWENMAHGKSKWREIRKAQGSH